MFVLTLWSSPCWSSAAVRRIICSLTTLTRHRSGISWTSSDSPSSTGSSGSLESVLNAFGLLVKPDGSNAAAVGLSLFFVIGSFVQIVGIIFSKPLADRFGKKAVLSPALR